MVRYGFIWSYLVETGGHDSNGDPVDAQRTWLPFNCDVQTSESGGSYIPSQSGDRTSTSYLIFCRAIDGIKKGGVVKDPDGNEHTILQAFTYGENLEIWV